MLNNRSFKGMSSEVVSDLLKTYYDRPDKKLLVDMRDEYQPYAEYFDNNDFDNGIKYLRDAYGIYWTPDSKVSRDTKYIDDFITSLCDACEIAKCSSAEKILNRVTAMYKELEKCGKAVSTAYDFLTDTLGYCHIDTSCDALVNLLIEEIEELYSGKAVQNNTIRMLRDQFAAQDTTILGVGERVSKLSVVLDMDQEKFNSIATLSERLDSIIDYIINTHNEQDNVKLRECIAHYAEVMGISTVNITSDMPLAEVAERLIRAVHHNEYDIKKYKDALREIMSIAEEV